MKFQIITALLFVSHLSSVVWAQDACSNLLNNMCNQPANTLGIDPTGGALNFDKAFSQNKKPPAITPDQAQRFDRIKEVMIPAIKESISKSLGRLPMTENSRELLKWLASTPTLGELGCPDEEQLGVHIINAFNSESANRLKAGGAALTGPQIRICKGLIQRATSDFAFAFVLAHEIAHSIDPCHTSRNDDQKPTFDASLASADQNSYFPKVLQCLRGAKSIHANTELMTTDAKGQPVDSNAHHTLCLNDSINEGFSDFIAVEALNEMIQSGFFKNPDTGEALNQGELAQGLANTMRNGCNKDSLKKHTDQEHSSFEVRTNKLLLAHPGIRSALGCAPLDSQKVSYCGGDSSEKEEGTSSAPTIEGLINDNSKAVKGSRVIQ